MDTVEHRRDTKPVKPILLSLLDLHDIYYLL